jgi:hypothetical protein
MTNLPWIVLALCLSAYGLLCLHKWRQRRAVNRIVCESPTGWEQRRKAWTVTEGDGIRPVRKRL